MKKVFAALALVASFMAPAMAATSPQNIDSLDVRGLTPQQKTDLLAQAAAMQADVKKPEVNVSQVVRTEATAWADLGTNMGKAAVATARELGMAANEFVNTPLGKITMGIVIFKVMGHELAGIVTGAFILVFFLSVALVFLLRNGYDGHVKYEIHPVLFGLFTKRKVVEGKIDVGTLIFNRFCALVMIALGLMVGIKTMF